MHQKTSSKLVQNVILTLIGGLFAGIVYVVDVNVSLGVAIGALYSLVILYSWVFPGKLSSVYFGLICSVLVVLGFIFSDDSSAIDHFSQLNRAISIIVIWVCTALVSLAKYSFAEVQTALKHTENKVEERTLELKNKLIELNKEQKKTQQSELKFKALIDSAPDAMIIIDQEGKIRLTNNQVKNVFEYEKEELIGKSIEVVIPERYKGKHPLHRKGFFTHSEARVMGDGVNLYGLKKNNKEFPLEISLSPLRIDSE